MLEVFTFSFEVDAYVWNSQLFVIHLKIRFYSAEYSYETDVEK